MDESVRELAWHGAIVPTTGHGRGGLRELNQSGEAQLTLPSPRTYAMRPKSRAARVFTRGNPWRVRIALLSKSYRSIYGRDVASTPGFVALAPCVLDASLLELTRVR